MIKIIKIDSFKFIVKYSYYVVLGEAKKIETNNDNFERNLIYNIIFIIFNFF